LKADEDLLRQCQAGDEEALAQLVRRYEARVFRLACRVTGDAALAEEAVVESFARVWAKAKQWRGESRAGTWIYQVALRTTLDRRRSRWRWWRRWGSPVPAEVPDPRPRPEECVAAADDRERLARRLADAMRHLSDADRALVHLYYFERLELAEIAEVLAASRDALKMRLARARQRLRGLLKEYDEPA
jgi:RNA polymerase sigma-70 factor (ECF subfamily)